MKIQMTIGRKLMGLCAVAVVLITAVGVAGYRGILTVSSGTQEMLRNEAKIAQHSAQARAHVLGMRRFEKDIFLNVQDLKKVEEYEKKHADEVGGLGKRLDDLKRLAVLPADKERVAKMTADLSSYAKAMPTIIAKIKGGQIKTPQDGNIAVGEYKDETHRLEKEAADWATEANERMEKIEGTLLSSAQHTSVTMGIFALVGIAVSLVVSFMIARSITAPLRRTVLMIKDVAQGEGDLTARLEVKSTDEVGEVCMWFNTFIEKLEGIIRSIGKNTQGLAGSAEELTSVSHQMSSNSEETAAQANVVSAASEQVSKNVQTVAAGAEEMGASIKEISKSTSEAARVAKEAVEVAEKTNQTITKLGESSAEIGNVIKVITSIAEQTNLLALNATIEAARAGEAGKGFAVVANEVKELAKQTGDATEDISAKIGAIQHDTQGAVAAIQQISGIINQVNDIANTIASAVEEQSVTTNEMSRNVTEAAKGSTEIVQNITGVAQAAQSTASGATQTQAAAQELARLASELQSAVGQFKYDDEGQEMKRVVRVKESTAKKGSAMKPQPSYQPTSSTLHTL